MIVKDLRDIKRHIRSQLGKDSDVNSHLVFDKGMKHYVNRGEYLKAAKILEIWNEWLFNRGIVEKVAEKLEINSTTTTISKEMKEYKMTMEIIKKLPKEEQEKLRVLILGNDDS
jgi:hypothetical protein